VPRSGLPAPALVAAAPAAVRGGL